MPHLSPMQWLLMVNLIWMIILMYSTINWWSQSPTFPKTIMLKNYMSTLKWYWL